MNDAALKAYRRKDALLRKAGVRSDEPHPPVEWDRAMARLSPEEQREVMVMACFGCGRDTHDEQYMVHDEVWQAAGMTEGFLCVRCIEQRLGRRLRREDFTTALINVPWPGMSNRLRYRIEAL